MAQTVPLSEFLENPKLQADIQKVIQGINEDGRTIQDIKGITDEEIETLYGLAYNFYTSRKLDDAIQSFGMLTMLNPYDARFWKGLGASLHVNKEFEKAIEVYGMAATMSGLDDPSPHLHAGECHIALNENKEALSALNTANEMAQRKPDFKWINDRAEALLSTLTENKTASAQI